MKNATMNTATAQTEFQIKSAIAMGMNVLYAKFPVAAMEIDYRYQRSADTDRSKLMKHWDEHKLQPLTCVYHFDEKKLYVVDGLGRLTVSQKIDPERYRELYCCVILDAPTDPDDRLKFEAKLFADQDNGTTKPRQIEKHNARVICEDPVAIYLKNAKKKYGFNWSSRRGGKQIPGVIGDYTSVYDITNVNGKECMDYILDIIHMSGFDRKSNGYARYVICALRDMYKFYPSLRDVVASTEILSKYLRNIDPEHLKAFSVQRYPMLSTLSAVSLFMEDVYVEKANVAHKRKRSGSKVIAA